LGKCLKEFVSHPYSSKLGGRINGILSLGIDYRASFGKGKGGHMVVGDNYI
jgi:hypothetical protein